uniref:Nucleotid_trans domain-containing protein n=1 Tax=Caenorhabditis tropicalis TaxID=1561998 RepID=A0A1I7T3R6_9PELO
MGRLKLAFRNVLVPLFFVYFFLHIGFTTWKLFQVDSSRIGYENLRDGPLLAKGGKHVKKGNVIEAIGYGKLSAMGFGNKMRKKPKQVHPVLRPKDEGVPELSEKVKTTVIEESQNLLNKTSVSSNFIYIAMINNAYERMTLNWICNTALMENVHNRTLIISMDSSTCHSIKTQWDETIKCVSLDIDNYKIGYDWGRQQYINILTLRANIMELLTSNDIPHVLIETDATWFKDVMNQLCASQHNGLVCRQFEYNEIADGKWFKMDEQTREIPYILNNNFNSGTKNKETRQALNGFWFLATKTNQCVISKVRRFMDKYS